MATKATEFGEASGYSSSRGYGYQILVGVYYLIVKEAREIEYEVDGEDFSIINEDSNRLSIEYIQAKYLDYGSFTLAAYARNVSPQFWDAFQHALEAHPEKMIKCTLITNVSWDRNLKSFIEACNKLKRGLCLKDIAKELLGTAVKPYQKMRKNKKEIEFQRFLFGLDVNYTWTEQLLEDSIIEYLKKCRVPDPHNKLGLIKVHIQNVGQGVVTRRRIEDVIGYTLSPIDCVSESAFADEEIKKTLELLEEKKSKCRIESDYPDKGSIFRDMTLGLKNAGDVIKFAISKNSGTDTNTHEFIEIIDSDIEKAHQDAESIASLEVELWTCKKKYNQRLTSIEKTAKIFDIKL